MEFSAKEFCELTTTELYEILKVRAEIFIIEQKIYCQDCDDIDYDSLHCFIKENDRILAYLRAYYTDDDKTAVKVGRVLTLKHGIGMGKELLEKSLPVIKNKMKCKKICMNAQKYAVGFYEKAGFKTVSGEFLEEGIVHIAMELNV
ncbi:MAG: GNAT family N-acetyltransferase [Clostridia bacterium]|nr:GNAT family N-acetyltransferase [Clostridia bacterium]